MKKFAFTLAIGLLTAATSFAQTHTYKVLATSKTSTMQKEMQEAGDAGFRFVAVMGGETGVGGKEVVVLMEKTNGDSNVYGYRLLATSKTSTLQKELQEAADGGFRVVGQTVFESTFGGKETAAIVEKAGSAAAERFEYQLVDEDVDDGEGAQGARRRRLSGDWPHCRQDGVGRQRAGRHHAS